ncbi:hydrolase, P-loop family [Pseudoramibacter alactolyticus ATCC 23263]|uniref:tRNA threonylcarbamoyladenosine biosynthesis protein TsaE n=1 Tax=Pseudoramibacter alactolyticus ATCC 23263 TaxID=887929 RepID=E6MDH6_9FIRM|nr:tRNA (adenosine(37)-N6)-threonylcarbamoyltransferase complex ATPase subunit type 1 TsaE [Pseudoramibacter alactolyticus]EFV02861.1 hydrolase, P-loop family [Pseudoramibacter alactolyticus ATCC 23263]
MEKFFKTTSPEATAGLGEALGRTLAGRNGLVYLTGDLGAGKTTLMQGIASGLGLDARVTSPTFALVNAYGRDEEAVYHMDLYRLEDMDELMEIGFEDFLADETLIFVEWPDLLLNEGYAPLAAIDLRRDPADAVSRIICFKTADASLAERVAEFES